MARTIAYRAPFYFGLVMLLLPGRISGQEQAKPVAVDTVEKREVYRKVRLSGSVMTPHFSNVSSEVAGLIDRLEVEEGDYVKAGEVLCSLDPTVTRHELEGSRADLTATKERLNESKRLLRETLSLSEDKIVPRTELDAKRAQVEILKANLRRQKAETNRIHEMLTRHKIKSPFSGIVGQKEAEIGEWVDQGQTVLTLIAIDPLRARFNMPESHYNRISTNTTVRLNFDALPDRTIEAKVTATVAFGDFQSRTFPVRIEFPNPSHRIIPGMSCEGHLPRFPIPLIHTGPRRAE